MYTILEVSFSVSSAVLSMSRKQLTAVASREGSKHGTNDHEDAAQHDGGPTAEAIGNMGGNEERDDGTDVVHIDEDTELVGVDILGEELLPLIHLLRGVEKHAIVTGGGRADEQEDGKGVELSQMGLLVPGHLLKVGRLLAGSVQILSRIGLHQILGNSDHDGQ